MARVCFVCLGNICRSPTAEGVFLDLLRRRGLEGRHQVDSAGTAGYHVGSPPDPRTVRKAAEKGVRLTSRARRFGVADFDRFDLIVVMDAANRRDVLAQARGDADRAKVRMFREWDAAADGDHDVPDPYLGGPEGFEEVYAICLRAAEGLLAEIEPGPRDRPTP